MSVGGYDEGIYRLYLGQVPMFTACTEAQIDELRGLAEPRTLNPGTVVVREGDPGDEFFVIGSGEATVTRAGETVANLGVGDFFGELALFDQAPRNATVVADSGVTLLVLGRSAFQKLLADLPGFRESVLMGMARRLHTLDAKA